MALLIADDVAYNRGRYCTASGRQVAPSCLAESIEVKLLRMTLELSRHLQRWRWRCVVGRRCTGDGPLAILKRYLECNWKIFQLILD